MLAFLLLTATAAPQDDFHVLRAGAHEFLVRDLLAVSRVLAQNNADDRRAATYSLQTALARQAAQRAAYAALLGPMPQRTPLETTVVGALQADGYRVERLHYQSRPGHHVTANLYVPDGSGPFPGVVVPCGHSDNGKAYDGYQRACALLALNGIVALVHDPVGQGERHQLELDRHGTTEHELLNVAGMLVGEPLVKHELWDGVRAIDVLLARPELGGATTVGVAGNSGGGTQTVFLTAWDERVAAATPACYVMQHQRLFETIGPQDGCQWLPGEGVVGLDHADYLALRAPGALRVLAAEQDFFEFASTREAFGEAARTWTALGQRARIDLVSTDAPHGWSRPLREACVQWMRWVFLGDDSPVVEPELEVFTDAELQVTASGQVLQEFEGERSVRDLLVERAAALRATRLPLTRASLRAAIGVRDRLLVRRDVASRWLGDCEVRLNETGDERVCFVEVLPPAPGFYEGTTLLLHDGGKLADPELVLELARSGRRVFSVDLSGYGETADRGADAKFHNPEHRVAMLGLHVGRPLLGLRVGEALALVEALALEVERAELIGVGRAGVVALHLAYLWPFERVELRDTLRSWEHDVVADPAAPNRLGNVIPGVLALYDLPDLEAALGERVSRRDD